MKTDKELLAHYTERQNQLEQWIKDHYYDHPDFDRNLRDLHIAENKVAQIKNRLNGQTYSGVECATIPASAKHYSHYSF